LPSDQANTVQVHEPPVDNGRQVADLLGASSSPQPSIALERLAHALMFATANAVAVSQAGSVVSRLARADRAQRFIEKIGGSIRVAFGMRLALKKD
jgi:threonine/homoserine/homoserine lactone efflux protein